MYTIVNITISFLLFSSFAFANMSDSEKRNFIESLAKPSAETKTFYRWQSKDTREQLLSAGQMTPALYEYYVGNGPEKGNWHLAGQGLYVSEDTHSSSNYGETVIKVEVEKGYPFIDLNEANIKARLQEKGITIEEAYRLKPRVAVKDIERDNWWCLKKREGIRFKPFVNQELIDNFKKAPLSFGKAGKKRFFQLLPKTDQMELVKGIDSYIMHWIFCG